MLAKANAICQIGQRAHTEGKYLCGKLCSMSTNIRCIQGLGFFFTLLIDLLLTSMIYSFLGEIKLAALRLQTANQAYCNNAKAFEEHVLKLTAADG